MTTAVRVTWVQPEDLVGHELRQAAEDGRDALVIRPCCYVTLTIDHRVLDGFQANRFMEVFVRRLEGWR